MARPSKSRKITTPPKMKGFKPFGLSSDDTGTLLLKFEEYESIRMVNYEKLSHEAAAKEMSISRPTFTRIYNRALNQIARSFVEGKTLTFEGGHYSLEKDWYRCKRCYKLIQGIENHIKCSGCPVYGESELIKIN